MSKLEESVSMKDKIRHLDRGGAETMLSALQSGETLAPERLEALSTKLLELGCFPLVLELDEFAATQATTQMRANAYTARSNLGILADEAVLERDFAAIPDPIDTRLGEELCGAIGRQYKERGFMLGGQPRSEAFRRSLACYRKGFENSLGAWSGINVPALHFWLGELEQAKRIAAELLPGLERDLANANNNEGDQKRHWVSASLGECFWLLGQFTEAMLHYKNAHQLCVDKRLFGDLLSMRRQLRRHLQIAGKPEQELDQYLPNWRVMLVAPCTIAASAAVLEQIKTNLKASVHLVVSGVGSVFERQVAEITLAVSREWHVLLSGPTPPSYESLIKKATRQLQLSQSAGDTSCDMQYLHELTLGSAIAQRKTFEAGAVLLLGPDANHSAAFHAFGADEIWRCGAQLDIEVVQK